MTDPLTVLNTLRRPSLLIRAARIGLTDYRRERDLRGLTHSGSIPSPDRALGLLLSEELRLEETRRTGNAAYSVSRHVEVLIAMMAEARLLPRRAVA